MLATQGQLYVALIVFVLCVAIIDWRTRRIPNALCAVAALVGLTSQVWMNGADGLLAAVGGAAVGFAMFLPFYVVRGFGAGDVKAMATVGVFLDVQTTLVAAGMTLIAGAVFGMAVLLVKPAAARAALERLAGVLASPVSRKQATRPEIMWAPPERFPYGIAIACGTTAALLIVTG